MPTIRWSVPLILALSSILASGIAAEGGDPEVGKAKTATCVACHGTDGVGTEPINPKLAGQYEEALVAAMLAYKDGRREHAAMQAFMQPLSEEDIRDIAAYYASQPCR